MAGGAAPLSTARGEDRLSALDGGIRHKIVAQYLTITEAACTAALSRRWRHLWRSTPLVLRDADLSEPARDVLVPLVLAEHQGHFRSVCLTDCRLASLDRELPGWPLVLAEKQTQRLHLSNRVTQDQIDTLPLPHILADILRCGSLKELSLGFWAFPVDLSHGAGIFLPHLRRLTLAMVVISDQTSST